ncbi:hypothetical protein PACTADRAFT_50412 [Pachysolen tannophilus NRRL Y-2460]|uniref:AHC1-like C2H2 zinc-finger domain-containing protein n=1 Tax=Pachysolen tannophilus NRRL Y-2460 TaxID=669874 RepID=A0A1E4TRZ7_PACTA|nr:hypothetical protein PACTADRAFT_50412 [Pachysolen tannophilus NRRL Y-2460]
MAGSMLESVRSPLSGDDENVDDVRNNGQSGQHLDPDETVLQTQSTNSNGSSKNRSPADETMASDDVEFKEETSEYGNSSKVGNIGNTMSDGENRSGNQGMRVIDGIYDEPRSIQKESNLSPEEKAKRVKEVISHQFDLEILLKHNQLTEIEEEIGKCEAQMIALRNKYNIDPKSVLSNESPEFTKKYLRILEDTKNLYNRHKSVAWNDNYLDDNRMPPPSNQSEGATYDSLYSRTRSHTSSLRPSSGRYSGDCIYKRTDGVLVRLTCSNCNRCNFSSAQGFLNHCRLAHQREFTSQDNAAIICGEILDDVDQDEIGLKVINDLKAQGLDPNKNLAKPNLQYVGEMMANNAADAPPLTNPPHLQLQQQDQQEKLVQLSDNGQPQPQNQKKRGRPPLTGGPSLNGATASSASNTPKTGNGNLASKTPRTTTNLKLRIKNLSKDRSTNFDQLVKDVTSEVSNPHLFEDEEEDLNEEDSIGSDSTFSVYGNVPSSVSSNRGGHYGSPIRGRGRGRGRGRRKSRGGFTVRVNNGETADKENTADEFRESSGKGKKESSFQD